MLKLLQEFTARHPDLEFIFDDIGLTVSARFGDFRSIKTISWPVLENATKLESVIQSTIRSVRNTLKDKDHRNES